MTLFFNDFIKHNNTLDLVSAIESCKNEGASTLMFEKNRYVFDDTFAPDTPVCVSNHGEIGYRKSAFFLHGIDNLTIDGSGSTFVFKGIMNAFHILDCKNVTVKNLTIEFPDYPYPNGFVSNIGENFFDMRFDSDKVILGQNDTLYVKNGAFCDRVHTDVRFDGITHEIVRGTGDNSLNKNLNDIKKELLQNGQIRFFDPPVMPKKTDVFGLLTGIRRASGILIDNSESTSIENVTIHSCIGIGVMAQNCKDVTIDRISVTASEGRYVSSAADATHFVGCTGNITVKNSLFEHMLDDALNVHGIYTSTVAAGEGYAVVKFMNSASVGIELYKKGDSVISVDPDTLKASALMTVKDAVLINRNHIRLTFEEGLTVKVGELIDNVSAYPSLLFENNVVQNNRARGMLIATNRPAVIKNCRFHTSGSAIVLECDGKFWFESGAVHDLTIENNVFDDCKYANWDRGVISIPEGKKIIDDFHYHGKIEIKNNDFIGENDVNVYADNVNELIYSENEGKNHRLLIKHVKEAKIQSNAEINK
jgi:hypothetical protein